MSLAQFELGKYIINPDGKFFLGDTSYIAPKEGTQFVLNRTTHPKTITTLTKILQKGLVSKVTIQRPVGVQYVVINVEHQN